MADQSTGLENPLTTSDPYDLSGLALDPMAIQQGLVEDGGISLPEEAEEYGDKSVAFTQGEDGNFYRVEHSFDDELGIVETVTDERVYAFNRGPMSTDVEKGLADNEDAMNRYNEDPNAWAPANGKTSIDGMLTEAEIKEWFDTEAPERMQDVGWDNYWGYLSDRQDALQSGELTTSDLMDPTNEINNALMSEYGIENNILSSDGQNLWQWNGSSYEHTIAGRGASKLDTALQVAVMIGGAALAGPLSAQIAAATGLSGAALAAATAGVISAGSQLALTGEIDLTQALVSAATAGLGQAAGDYISTAVAEGTGGLFEAIGTVTGSVDDAVDFLSQGNTIADAAIRAGGMSMLTQAVTTGEVSLEQAAMASLIAGGAVAMQEFGEWYVGEGGGTTEELQGALDQVQENVELQKVDGSEMDYDWEQAEIDLAAANEQIALSEQGVTDINGDGTLTVDDLAITPAGEVRQTLEQIEDAKWSPPEPPVSYDPEGGTLDYDPENAEHVELRFGGIADREDLKNALESEGIKQDIIDTMLSEFDAVQDAVAAMPVDAQARITYPENNNIMQLGPNSLDQMKARGWVSTGGTAPEGSSTLQGNYTHLETNRTITVDANNNIVSDTGGPEATVELVDSLNRPPEQPPVITPDEVTPDVITPDVITPDEVTPDNNTENGAGSLDVTDVTGSQNTSVVDSIFSQEQSAIAAQEAAAAAAAQEAAAREAAAAAAAAAAVGGSTSGGSLSGGSLSGGSTSGGMLSGGSTSGSVEADPAGGLTIGGSNSGVNTGTPDVPILSTTESIEGIYQSALGRPADAAGLDYWTQQVESGAMTLAQVESTIGSLAATDGNNGTGNIGDGNTGDGNTGDGTEVADNTGNGTTAANDIGDGTAVAGDTGDGTEVADNTGNGTAVAGDIGDGTTVGGDTGDGTTVGGDTGDGTAVAGDTDGGTEVGGGTGDGTEVTGTPGTNGTAGADGIDGVNGTNGTNGTNGANGLNGLNGADGGGGGSSFSPAFGGLLSWTALTGAREVVTPDVANFVSTGRGMLS